MKILLSKLLRCGSLFFLICASIHGETLPRKVLSPWSSGQTPVFYHSPVIRHVESVLNHLGIFVEYFDVDAAVLPKIGKELSKEYLGVVTFFETEKLTNAPALMKWLGEFSKTGLPWVALGQFGFLESKNKSEILSLFQKFGVEFISNTDVPFSLKSVVWKKEAVGFERQPDLVEFPPIRASGEHWLKVQGGRKREERSAVFFGSRLKGALGRYGLYSQGEGRKQWVTDPYLFFRKAFTLDPWVPVPDVNVLNGNRVFFSHIDGDAFNSVSLIDRNSYCGEIMDREVIQGFADLPFGVSLIVAEIHPEYRGNSRLVEAAKKILAHGNVEPASHTFFHPFSWTKRTLAYDGGSRSYSLEREVSEAANYLQTLVPIGKRIGTIYWSGDCMPPEKAFELAGRDGLLNLNGGDGVWDSEFPSIAYLAPLGRPVGKYFQVFSSNANDNIYTNGWEGPFYGFSKVKETFQRTGKPHILRPINPYFHFFLAEKAVGLKSLKEVLQWSLKQEISPIYPSEYIHSVMAYRNVKLHRLGKKTFRVGPLQGLTTLRVDARDAHLDLKASSGVLGYRRLNSSLYIHLAPNVSEAQVVLAAARRPSEKPHLKSVGGKVVSFIADNKKVVVKLGAFARPPLVLRGLTASATISKGAVVSSRVVGDGVNIDFPVKSEEQSIEVTL